MLKNAKLKQENNCLNIDFNQHCFQILFQSNEQLNFELNKESYLIKQSAIGEVRQKIYYMTGSSHHSIIKVFMDSGVGIVGNRQWGSVILIQSWQRVISFLCSIIRMNMG
ncbi:hypothetical protein D3C79_927300 [compost metagenome]